MLFITPLSFMISLKDTSFHIYLISLGIYLSPECLLNFLWLASSSMGRINVSIYGVQIPRKCIEFIHFYSCPCPPLKTSGRKSVSPKTKGVEETMICFIKVQSENMKTTWNISLFMFWMICNFSKCDGFISTKQCAIKFIASPLQPWQFDTKITSQKIATLMQGGFL